MKEKWSGSNSLIKVVSVQPDPNVPDRMAVTVDFETVAQTVKDPRAEVIAELDVILAKREYTLDLCLSFSTSRSETNER
jgi:hypothetical protein